jgi:hypothetical protein
MDGRLAAAHCTIQAVSIADVEAIAGIEAYHFVTAAAQRFLDDAADLAAVPGYEYSHLCR